MSLNWIFLNSQKDWTDDDRKTLNGLIWITMGVGISYLGESSIDEFVYRANLIRSFNKEIERKDLEKFIGLRTNVRTETRIEWARRRITGYEGKEINAKWRKKVGDEAWSDENNKKEKEIVKKRAEKEKEKKVA